MFHSGENSCDKIDSLFNVFSQLRVRIDQEEATFLDCGSGDGVAAIVAYFAGFNRVYGIERCRELFECSLSRLDKFVENGVISDGSVLFTQGSYYQVELLPGMVDRSVDLLRRLYVADNMFESCEMVDFVSAVLDVSAVDGSLVEDIVQRHIFPFQNSAYRSLDLINKEQLSADVVYIYPSDVFFEDVFISQMGYSMKPGSLLSVLTTSEEAIIAPISQFKEQQQIPLESSTEPAMSLQVFQRL